MLHSRSDRVSKILVSILCSFGSMATCAAEGEPIPALDPARTLLRDVNIVDLEHGRVHMHRTISIRDGRIEAIHDDPAFASEGARVIECRGERFVMPGLVDMHLHLPPDDGTEKSPAKRTLALLLANGVTTARGMAGHPSHIGLRERLNDGSELGPTLYVAGPPLHYASVSSASAASQAVAKHDDLGFDLIKSHHIVAPEIFDAIQTTAKERGIPVAGHVTNEIGWKRALAAHMQFEHLDGIVFALMRPGYDGEPFGQFPPLPALERVDEDRLPEIADAFADQHVPNTPTLALFEAICDGTTPTDQLAARDEMKYVPKATLAQWKQQRDGRLAAGFPEPEMAKRFVDLRRKIVRALRDAKAPLMVGSDCPQDFFVEGFATHAEMEALENAGITSREVLLSATHTPAEYLNALPKHGSAKSRAADFGTLTPGNRADLLILGKNPLEGVAHTRSIESVILRGRVLDRAALDALLATAAQLAGQ